MTTLSFVENLELPAASSAVWDAAKDVDLLVACVPGAQLTGVAEDGALEGEIKVAFGPTRATFRGRLRYELDEATMVGRLDAQGSDARGATRARAALTFTVADSDSASDSGSDAKSSGGSSATLDIEIEFVGALASFMGTAGRSVTQHLIDSFAACFRARVAPDNAEPAAAAAAAGALDVGAAMRSSFRAAVRRAIARVRRWFRSSRKAQQRSPR
jgi:carbon monoxide dehydrogenase subunit G